MQREEGSYAGINWRPDPERKMTLIDRAKTAVLECFYCKHTVADNPQQRRYLNDTGRYIVTKPDGDPTKISYRWNALANIDVSFASLAMEYIQAKDRLELWGNKTALQEFRQKRLAKDFNDNLQSAILSKIITEPYDPNSPWQDEAYRFMTIDCQQSFNEFWYVIRSWSKDANSRLIKWGRAPTFDDLAKIQKENNVRDWCVGIDAGYRATTVYAEQIKRGHFGMIAKRRGKEWLNWISLKGWPAKDFPWPDGTKRLYATPTKGDHNLGDAAKGKVAWHYRFASDSIKSMLVHLRDGKSKVKWTTSESDSEYERQMNAEILQRVIDKNGFEKWTFIQKAGVPNHIWDCECMNLAMASMRGIAGNI